MRKTNPLILLAVISLLFLTGCRDGMKTTCVPLFFHTANEKEEIDECFVAGISGIYTDNIENYLP